MSLRAMTMRKMFAGVTVTSLAGVAILGGVFAWKTSDYAKGAALVGKNSFEVRYAPNCNLPGPLEAPLVDTEGDAVPIPCLTLIGYNGVTTRVGKGVGANNGNFKLQVVGGRVGVRALSDEGRECKPAHFSGQVRLLNPGEIIPPGGEGGAFYAFLNVNRDAPADCQGEIVYYKVVIEAENPQLTAAEAEPVE